MTRAVQILMLLCVLALVVTLVGCGSVTGASDGATVDTAAKPPPPPPPDPTPCKIAFNILTGKASKRAVHIFTINTNGTDQQQITEGTGEYIDPAWSPDGQWLCYSYGPLLGSSIRELYRMHLDGSGVEQLTFLGDGRSGNAAWSPDGSRIAFSHAGAIAVLDVNSKAVTDLTQLAWSGYTADHSPRWLPDGATIIFCATTGPNATYCSLYTVPSTTVGAPHEATLAVPGGRWVDWRHETDASGNSQITYTLDYKLYIAKVDSAGVLVEGSQEEIAVGMRATWPSWAPDGSAIAFESIDDYCLYTVELADTEVQQLSAVAWYPPDWSPPIFGE